MEEIRICPKCKRELPLRAEYFNKNAARTNGFESRCRECMGFDFRYVPPEGFKVCNACKGELPKTEEYFYKAVHGEFQPICISCHNAKSKEYRTTNIDIERIRAKKYYEEHKEEVSIKSKNRRDNNLEEYRDRARKSAEKHKDRRIQYVSDRYYSDIQFNLCVKIRSRIRMALKSAGVKKSDKTINLLGCNYVDFYIHLESTFTDGMTLEKVFSAEIEIDHIIPTYLFDLTDPEQQKKAFHYSNTRAMWATENHYKNSEYMGIRHSHRKEKRELLTPFLPKNNL